MAEEIQQAPTQEQAQAPQLTLQDLTLALQIIQVVSQRGAIRAEEMEAVGALHNRLFAFLQAQGALVSKTAEAPAEEESAEAPQGE